MLHFLHSFFISHFLHQPIHIPCNLLVSDLGIDLRAGNRRMPHHLGYALNWNTCLQGQHAEAVATDIVGQRSTNATRQTHGFSIQSALTGIPQPNTLSTDSSCPTFLLVSPRFSKPPLSHPILSQTSPPFLSPLAGYPSTGYFFCYLCRA